MTTADASTGARWLRDLQRDVPYAMRVLRRTPGFTILALLTLAIGVGANTAIYSVVDAAILRPLPFRDADRLMKVSLRMPMPNAAPPIDMSWSYPKYDAFLRAQSVFEDQTLYLPEAVTVTGADGADRVIAEVVGARYFAILGVPAARGRVFDDIEDRKSGGAAVALISDGYWRRQYGAGPAIGRSMTINGRPYTIAGVLPPGFRGLGGSTEVWVLATAIRPASVLDNAGVHQFQLVARRKAGVSEIAAKEGTRRAGQIVDGLFPDSDGHWGASAYALDEVRTDPTLRRAVVVLAVAVALVLLIACVNIANLLLARGAARRTEMAVRLALGANRGRLVRQLLTESLLLATAGAAAAMVVASWSVHLFAARLEAMAPAMSTIFGPTNSGLTHVALSGMRLDARALGFTALVAFATGLIFGLAPAVAAARVPLALVLRSGSTAQAVFGGLRRLTGRGMLVAAEVALAVMLLVAAGLTIRSLDRLVRTSPGYDAEQVVTARIGLSPARFSNDSALVLWNELLDRVRALPGVSSAAVASCAPVGDQCEGTSIDIAGQSQSVHVGMVAVSPDFFRTMRTPLLRGRAFTDADRRGAQRVIMINETAAKQLWGSADPLTTGVRYGNDAMVVAGIVGDIRFRALERTPDPVAFFPYAQMPRSRGVLFVRSSGDAAPLFAALRREVRAIDWNHAIYDLRAMTDRLRDATARSRITTIVLTSFAWVALVLAAVGIYGVLALAVAQRTRELGIRIALGAERGQVVRLVLGQAMALAALGGVVGLAASAAAVRGLSALLYETAPLDAVSFGGAALVLMVAVILAALVPALRATRVSPLEALKN
jgi:predicted permease